MADQLVITNAKINEAYTFYVTLTTSGAVEIKYKREASRQGFQVGQLKERG